MDTENKNRYQLYTAYRESGKDHDVIVDVMKLNQAEIRNFPAAYEEDKQTGDL